MSATVLIVEDEPDLAKLLRDVLEEAGYGVVLSAAGAAAECASALAPDLILIDYVMPGLTGEQVLDAMRVSGPLPPVVLVTARANAPEIAATLQAQAYLRKPFDVDHLLGLVAQLTRAE